MRPVDAAELAHHHSAPRGAGRIARRPAYEPAALHHAERGRGRGRLEGRGGEGQGRGGAGDDEVWTRGASGAQTVGSRVERLHDDDGHLERAAKPRQEPKVKKKKRGSWEDVRC